MLIDVDQYPNIMAALHCIQEDSGDRLRIPVLKVPDRWDYALPEIEKLIGTLSKKARAPESPPHPPHVKPNEFLDSEFYTFCNGEYDEQHAIANRSGENTLAHVFLTDFFEGWFYTDDVTDTPKKVCVDKRVEFLREVDTESSNGLTEKQTEELKELLELSEESIS